MTLRAKVDEMEAAREDDQKVREALQIERFVRMIKDVKEYFLVWGDISYVSGVPIIIVGLAERDAFIEAFRKEMEYTIYWSGADQDLDYYSKELESDTKCRNSAWWSRFDESDSKSIEKLKRVVNNYTLSKNVYLLKNACRHVDFSTEVLRHYIIFWNLFLAAMDDEIYNEQLATVAELAACFGFDEPMMRDWCRAVEYVFAGNKLSEDCDLHCETVEGAKFFLHKEE